MAHDGMDQIPAWCHFLCPAEAVSQTDVNQRLDSAGIQTYPYRPEALSGPGLLFFSEFTPQLCESLRKASCGGLERVFALPLSNSALPNGDIWRLLKAGASEVLPWDPGDDAPAYVAAKLRHWRTIDQLVRSPLVRNTLVGISSVWRRILRCVVEVALTPVPVLILGESGTGKELVAQLVHTLDSRKNKGELQVLDCTTIVPELSGSELFGHERGAFTHAVSSRDGAFALADGGTLFLDEIGELPLALQAQLLRVVQEHAYKRVGGNTWHRTDFRLLCATHRNLPDLVKRGEFRHDLYYRIAGCTVELPPLREHTEDTLPLVCHFIEQRLPEQTSTHLDQNMCGYFLNREYPGNVRQLKQLVSRIADRHVGRGPITVGDVPEDERPAADLDPLDWRNEIFEGIIRRALLMGAGLKTIGRAAEDMAVDIAMENENGNLQRAARKLGVTDRALQLRRATARRSCG